LHYFTELETLGLPFNKINNIQPILKLVKLEKLDLSYNIIEDITLLKNLKHLKYIDLSCNPITDLESLLDFNMRFNSKENYKVSKNEILINDCDHITNPPIDVVKRGDEAIRRYFNKIKEEGVDYIYEAKLILVGEGSSGKTSLQKRLLNEKADLPKNDERTRGIEVVDFEFDKGKIAHIWDFGGQVVYYPVHRFFITENSVFVLLASTRHNAHNFDYWLPTIFQFGGKSPVIIGQTCHDGNTARWNDLNTYLGNQNFNIIKTLADPYYQINLPDNNKGLNTIKDCIISQIKGLHHFGKPVPKSWSTVRNALFENSKLVSHISFQTFVDLCKGLAPDRFKNKEDIEDCCNFLHSIGVVLWYSKIEELKGCVILKPEWAMDAVYKIIDDKSIQEHNGHINPDDFTRLWNDKSAEEHVVLKKMLETFKIAFPTKHSNRQYIIPARLTSMPPGKLWELEENFLHLEYEFEFMPKGIVNQLSAELSRYIQGNEVWNNAVNLTINETKSQIIEDAYNRILTITSKGINAQGINMLIMNALKNIIESYKGVKEEINVKCFCKDCQKSKTPSAFSYNQLLEKLKKNPNAIVTCNRSDKVFNVVELLYDVGLGKTGNKIIPIFLASSEELKGDREQFEIFINRENKELIKKGVFIELVVWEDFIDCMAQTKLQDEYNKAAIHSEIFISLFWTKVGMYTKEEFGKAYAHFKEKGKPSVYTYFKNEVMRPNVDNRSRLAFVEELKKMGHYPTYYENIDNLKYQFKMQLQKILPDFN